MITPLKPPFFTAPRIAPRPAWCRLSLALILVLFSVVSMAETPREIDWVELIPEHDLEALLNPPEWVYEIDDGAFEDDAATLFSGKAETPEEERYRQALQSTDVVEEMNGQYVRVPGFVVPLSILDARLVDEFFLVPYMGACLHLPPPPPNQVIHVRLEKGLELTSLYQPYWIEGTLLTRHMSHDLAESVYALDATGYEIYTDD